MKHTNGPWTIKVSEVQLDHTRVISEHGTLICQLVMSPKTDEANARLIASAPEMFNALELVLNDDRLMNAMNRDQAIAILDAIRKAKGA